MITRSLSSRDLLAHPFAVAWRNRLRRSSLVHGLYKRWVARHDYEERFSRGLLAAVQPGDVVWDIGANVGLYTERFLQLHAARVVCFEPAPDAVQCLHRKFGRGSPYERRAHIVPVALSDARGIARFSADRSSPTNRIADQACPAGNQTIEVLVRTGDEAMMEFALPRPHVVKIDVEGYELEVIEGMRNVLSSPVIRAVFVEVHFALLHERGLDDAPSKIISALSARGLRTRWLDPSHLAAVRTG
jgi:FkbM family methyltransferase